VCLSRKHRVLTEYAKIKLWIFFGYANYFQVEELMEFESLFEANLGFKSGIRLGFFDEKNTMPTILCKYGMHLSLLQRTSLI
jgi:hypothetical protein